MKKSLAVFRISVSSLKGEKKRNVQSVKVTMDGIDGDAHAGTERPLSLLPYESIEKLAGKRFAISPGDFGENITTVGVDFGMLRVGTRVALGDAVVLEVIQLGKDCHHGCEIKETVGDCIMPREGLFARVIAGGQLKQGDFIKVLK